MIRIALCDDTPSDLHILQALLEEMRADAGHLPGSDQCMIDCFSSGEALLKKIDSGVFYTVLMIDVVMGGMSGMELATRLREKGVESDIIFTTGSTDFAVDAFGVNAKDYLVKPIDVPRLTRALRRCQKLNAAADCITLTVNKRNVQLAREEILYVESYSHICVFHAADREVSCYMTMDAVSQLLSGVAFARCHKSYIVNLRHVRSIQPDALLLEGGISIPLSRSMRAKIHEAYDSYLIHKVWEKRRHD